LPLVESHLIPLAQLAVSPKERLLFPLHRARAGWSVARREGRERTRREKIPTLTNRGPFGFAQGRWGTRKFKGKTKTQGARLKSRRPLQRHNRDVAILRMTFRE
jgi:hypothetical protein